MLVGARYQRTEQREVSDIASPHGAGSGAEAAGFGSPQGGVAKIAEKLFGEEKRLRYSACTYRRSLNYRCPSMNAVNWAFDNAPTLVAAS